MSPETLADRLESVRRHLSWVELRLEDALTDSPTGKLDSILFKLLELTRDAKEEAQ